MPSVQSAGGGVQLVWRRCPTAYLLVFNEVWNMDVVSHALASGRRIKCLTMADDFTHESVDIVVVLGCFSATREQREGRLRTFGPLDRTSVRLAFVERSLKVA